MKSKVVLLLFGLICSAIWSTAAYLGFFEYYELKSLDVRFRLFAEPEKASRDIVIAAIDENSLRVFKKNNIVWKWPRDLYAALVRYLHRGGAKVIVFDILFPDHDVDRLSSDAEQTDGAFAEAMKEANNVILASHLLNTENLLAADNPVEKLPESFVMNEQELPSFGSYSQAIFPIPEFQTAMAATGAANYNEDSDGIIRKVPLFFTYKNWLLPHLGTMAFLFMKGSREITSANQHQINLGGLSVPVEEDGEFLIRWYGKPGPDGCFTYYSIGALISSAIAEEMGQEPSLPASHFKDKIVIVGSNASALSDFRNTPFSNQAPFPGMEIYATMISNFLQKDFLARSPNFLTIVIIILFIFVIFYSFIITQKVKYIVSISLISSILWTIAVLLAFSSKLIWLDWIAPQTAIIFAFLVAAIVSYQSEGKARRRLRNIFGKYLSPIVISEVIDKSDHVELGGEEITATIYFSDIKDFTTISEKISPRELVALLNEYFSLNTEIVLQNQGLLDKYIGDAIMAVFGAPIEQRDHAHRACRTALTVQKILAEYNRKNADHKPEMITRIGINTGKVVVGNIGSDLRLDYTAIGDSVNLASRLEGVNKLFSTLIIVSESTRALIKDDFATRYLDRLQVKGKNQPIKIYELLGAIDEISKEKRNFVNSFHEVIDFYHERQFSQALSGFKSLLKTVPDDGPTLLYINRCEQFLMTPPPEDWDGVFKLKTK